MRGLPADSPYQAISFTHMPAQNPKVHRQGATWKENEHATPTPTLCSFLTFFLGWAALSIRLPLQRVGWCPGPALQGISHHIPAMSSEQWKVNVVQNSLGPLTGDVIPPLYSSLCRFNFGLRGWGWSLSTSGSKGECWLEKGLTKKGGGRSTREKCISPARPLSFQTHWTPASSI